MLSFYSKSNTVKCSLGNRGRSSLRFEIAWAKSQSWKNEGKITIGIQNEGKNANAPIIIVVGLPPSHDRPSKSLSFNDVGSGLITGWWPIVCDCSPFCVFLSGPAALCLSNWALGLALFSARLAVPNWNDDHKQIRPALLRLTSVALAAHIPYRSATPSWSKHVGQMIAQRECSPVFSSRRTVEANRGTPTLCKTNTKVAHFAIRFLAKPCTFELQEWRVSGSWGKSAGHLTPDRPGDSYVVLEPPLSFLLLHLPEVDVV